MSCSRSVGAKKNNGEVDVCGVCVGEGGGLGGGNICWFTVGLGWCGAGFEGRWVVCSKYGGAQKGTRWNAVLTDVR